MAKQTIRKDIAMGAGIGLALGLIAVAGIFSLASWRLTIPAAMTSTPMPASLPSATATSPPSVAPEPSPSLAATATPEVVTYTVQEGDTLWDIANDFHVDYQAIVDANNLSNPDLIRSGTVLTIPLFTSSQATQAPDLPIRVTPAEPPMTWPGCLLYTSPSPRDS